jgi:ATP-dependent DNA helicase RecG
VRTARDLLLRLPRTYEDLRRVTPVAALADLPDGTAVLVRGVVKRLHIFPRRLLDVLVDDEGATVRARWFRAPGGMARAFPKGASVAVAGALHTARDGTRELLQPSVVTAALLARGGAGLGIRPRYGQIPGVPGRTLERVRAAALAAVEAGGTADLAPEQALRALGLPLLGEALRTLHAPSDDLAGTAPARRRVLFERAFVAQLALAAQRAADPRPAWTLTAAQVAEARSRAVASLPFQLTAAQVRAADEIAVDLSGGRPMRRLLVGDTGSGKTAVAFIAAALVAATGAGTLMMVPTEVLAEQQARALATWAGAAGLRTAALTGGMPARARAAAVAAWDAGELDLLVGTHALLTAGLAQARVGLAIVDEQHRFGVAQRARLSGPAHLLAMSATPIPRSLALVLHGDLDASFLTERPPGRRTAPALVCATPALRAAAWDRLRDAIGSGQQAFVVCPVREEARRAGAVTALAAHARLARTLAPVRVGLLHGALGPVAKERALRAFAAGDTPVLVATTVVELGIDVPAATVMLIEDADKLGLAQLHQLRGRVGRGTQPGLCFLLASEGLVPASAGMARLEQLAALDDGFRLAEADLAQRGFGDLLGTEQAGASVVGGAAAEDDLATVAELFRAARSEAEAILQRDPRLAHPEHARLGRALREAGTVGFAAEAG